MIRAGFTREPRRGFTTARRISAGVIALAVGLLTALASIAPAAAAPDVQPGDSVYVGEQIYVSGSAILFPVWKTQPADLANPGTPDYWAYCIEQTVHAHDGQPGTVGEIGSFVGGNYFATDPSIPGKVLWVLAHSYPTLSIADLAVAAGIPSLTLDDAISGTTTAVWRYTDVTFDAPYYWISQNAEDLYWYLVGGANASAGMTSADFAVDVSLTAPAAAQVAGSLVGPFVVSTDQAVVSVSASPALVLTDAAGAPIDPAAVVDGQEVYVDARGETAAGSVTLTASASGSSATGKVITLPTTPGGTATPADHGQSLILVAAGGSTTDVVASAAWAALAVPAIGTTATTGDPLNDKLLPSSGGTVTDAVAYSGLTPGTVYTLEGELYRAADGTATGITGSTTFTPTSATGSVDVVFTVPTGFAGQNLVAFEWLYAAGSTTPVAQHTDLADTAQTVGVRAAATANSAGSGGGTGGAPARLAATGQDPQPWPWAVATVLLLAGTAMRLATRRRRA